MDGYATQFSTSYYPEPDPSPPLYPITSSNNYPGTNIRTNLLQNPIATPNNNMNNFTGTSKPSLLQTPTTVPNNYQNPNNFSNTNNYSNPSLNQQNYYQDTSSKVWGNGQFQSSKNGKS